VEGDFVKIRIGAFVAAFLLFGLPCSGQVDPRHAVPAVAAQKPNYTITITPPSGPLSLNSPLLVEVYYTNTTTSSIYLNIMVCKTCTPEHFVLTKDSKEVETTAFQKMSTGRGQASDLKDLHPGAANGRVARFPPGVFWKFNLDLRKLYNITEPGQYKLSASRTEETNDGKAVVVKSNTVTLDIVP
jgi:hypothetical protein